MAGDVHGVATNTTEKWFKARQALNQYKGQIWTFVAHAGAGANVLVKVRVSREALSQYSLKYIQH